MAISLSLHYKMKKIYLIFTLVFGGCYGDTIPNSQQLSKAEKAWNELDGKTNYTNNKSNIKFDISKNIPNWFYAPPTDNNYFYGAGEGRNIQEAKNSALNFIGGEIQTSLSSKVLLISAYSKGQLGADSYHSAREEIKSKVQKIDFTNIKIIKVTKVNNLFYVLLKIEKTQLFNNLKKEFEKNNKQIEYILKNSENYSPFEKLKIINDITPLIKKGFSQITILSILNSGFNGNKYVDKYIRYLNIKNKIIHNLTFAVNTNSVFGEKVIEVLNKKGYKVAKNGDIKIKLSKHLNFTTPYGMGVLRGEITIKMILNNTILYSDRFIIKGIGNTKQQAEIKAGIDFKTKLEKKGFKF